MANKNVLIFGESGAGKTFTSLKMLDGLKEIYGKKDGTANERIPIFVELSQVKNSDLEEFIREYVGVGKKQFDSDKAKKEDIIEYLAKFENKFESSQVAESFYENLPELIKEFISIPVFLYFMVSIYKKGEPVEIKSPGELICKYEDFLSGIRDGEFSRPDMEDVYRKELIPFIAFNMCQNSETDITISRFNHYINCFKKKYKYSILEKFLRNYALIPWG